LEFADEINWKVAETWFTKRRVGYFTYKLGGCRTVIDYMMIGQDDSKKYEY